MAWAVVHPACQFGGYMVGYDDSYAFGLFGWLTAALGGVANSWAVSCP